MDREGPKQASGCVCRGMPPCSQDPGDKQVRTSYAARGGVCLEKGKKHTLRP